MRVRWIIDQSVVLFCVKDDSCVSLWWGYVVHCPGKSVKLFTAILSYFVDFLGSFFLVGGEERGFGFGAFMVDLEFRAVV